MRNGFRQCAKLAFECSKIRTEATFESSRRHNRLPDFDDTITSRDPVIRLADKVTDTKLRIFRIDSQSMQGLLTHLQRGAWHQKVDSLSAPVTAGEIRHWHFHLNVEAVSSPTWSRHAFPHTLPCSDTCMSNNAASTLSQRKTQPSRLSVGKVNRHTAAISASKTSRFRAQKFRVPTSAM
ncbi:uncharacterized protein UHO2_00849 [Ustilago hordei]|uniref:uncharacterized protein n=1 Tax=Ustilago hordei TaxID=120017 RepID=UPI001A612144|nr:uncharacterized protein UHO2_00849 [Ustilago hordei]SYW73984.1 uncharacterized protein UHO2_00849 [Ustilago hordei]